MKRTISILLTLSIFATFFAGLTVSASAATNEWSIYSEHSYYDAKIKTDYHVVFSFKESYKTRLFFFKDYYISQMKVDTYVTTFVGSKAKVEKKTSVLTQNSKTGTDTCIGYLETYYPTLYTTYKETFQEQENYRMVYIHKMSGSISSIMSKWSSHTIQKYIDKYKQYVRDGFTGDVNAAIAKASGVVLPAPLELLGSASSVNDDAEDLKELCVDVIDMLYNSIELYWLERMMDATQLANGAPLVKELLEVANTHATSTNATWKTLGSDKRVKLETGIYTHRLG